MNKPKMFKFEIEEPKTLREKIYIALRNSIVSNHFAPGKRIFEREIAIEFNVSITPVREAILQLSTEGFLEIKSYKDVIVSSVSLKEINEIYETQAVLEGLLGKLAVPNMTDVHLVKMEKLTKKLADYFKRNKIDKFYETNEKIHEIYIKQSGNDTVKNIISKLNLRKRMFRYRITFLSKREVMEKAIKDHIKIYKAFLSHDQKKVERIISKHWRSDSRSNNFKISMLNELNDEANIKNDCE